jgi:hypothetical protein
MPLQLAARHQFSPVKIQISFANRRRAASLQEESAVCAAAAVREA